MLLAIAALAVLASAVVGGRIDRRVERNRSHYTSRLYGGGFYIVGEYTLHPTRSHGR